MTDAEKLDHAYNTLVRHNEWRKGILDEMPSTQAELTAALDTAIKVLGNMIVLRDDCLIKLKRVEG